MKEKQIQNQILNYLKLLENQGKCWAVRTQSGKVPILRRNGSKGWMTTGRRGCPDIVCCFKFLVKDETWIGMEYWQSRFVAIEVKSDKGKQSRDQKETEELIKKLGGIYLVARSVDDLIKEGIK